jgi:adenylate kinase family enzyme
MGIAIFGLNGAGKSTLTHAVAKEIGYYEMDVEDYYFPEQRESRKQALEQAEIIDIGSADKIPYSNARSKAEVQEAILKEIKAHSDFILAGVNLNWCEEILSRIEIAFWVKVPLALRLERIQQREEKRFGARTLTGGDMYEQQKEFRKVVAGREEKSLEECVQKLKCPVAVLDGTLPMEDNLKKIATYLHRKNADI